MRLTDHHLAHAWQPTWQRLRRTPPPFLRHRGTYGGDDLYEILPAPEQGLLLERWVSYDFLVDHPLLETSVRPIARRPGRAAWVELTLNDRRLTRVPLDRPRLLRHRLEPPYHRAAPNVIRLTYGYERVGRRRPGADIGTTGVRSPVDLVVLSGGQPYGEVGSVRVNAVEHARNRRGYNLVALDPAGRVLGAETFDTFFDPAAVRGSSRSGWRRFRRAASSRGPSGTRRPAGSTARRRPRPRDARRSRGPPRPLPRLARVRGREGRGARHGARRRRPAAASVLVVGDPGNSGVTTAGLELTTFALRARPPGKASAVVEVNHAMFRIPPT